MSALARGLPLLVLLGASGLMDQANYGRLALVVTGFTLSLAIGDSGLDSAATLLGPQRKHSGVLRSLLVARLLLTPIATSLAAIFLYMAQLPSFHLVLAACAALMAHACMSLTATQRVRARLEGSGELRLLLNERILSSTLFAAVVLAGLPLEWIVVGYFSSYAVAAALSISRSALRTSASGLGGGLRELFREAAPFGLSVSAANVIWRSGILVLGVRGQFEAAGSLSAAILPIQALAMISSLGSTLVLLGPLPSRRKANSQLLASGVLSILSMACLLGYALTISIAPPMGALNSQETQRTILVLSAVMPMVWFNPLLGMWNRVARRRKEVAAGTVAGAFTTVAITLSISNEMGAALGIVAGELTIAAFMWRLMRTWRRG